MATNSEKIEELIRLVTQLVSRVDKIEGDVDWATDWVEKLRTTVEDVRNWQSTAKQDIGELKKAQEEWGRRAWSLVVPIVTAIAGGVVGYLLKR